MKNEIPSDCFDNDQQWREYVKSQCSEPKDHAFGEVFTLGVIAMVSISILVGVFFSSCATKPPVVIVPPVVKPAVSAKPSIVKLNKAVDNAAIESAKTIVKIVEVRDTHAAALVLAKSIELRIKDSEITKLREMIESESIKLQELQDFSERTQISLSEAKDELITVQLLNADKEREAESLRVRNASLVELTKAEIGLRQTAEESLGKATKKYNADRLGDKLKIKSLRKYFYIVWGAALYFLVKLALRIYGVKMF